MKTLLCLLLLILCHTWIPCVAADLNTSVRTEYFLERARNRALPHAQRLAAYDSVIRCQRGNVSLDVYCEKARLLEGRGLYPKALRVYREAMHAVDTTSPGPYSRLLLNSAVAAYHSNSMREAISDVYKIFSIAKPDSMLHYDMDGYRLLSYITGGSANYDMAARYMERGWECLRRAEKAGVPRAERDAMLMRLHFAQSQIYMGRDNYQAALDELRKAKELVKDSLWRVDIYGAMGHISELSGNMQAAGEFYREALSYNDYHPNRAVNIGYYIMLQLKLGHLQEARAMLERNAELFNAFAGSQVEPYVAMLRYDVAKALGDTPGALASLEKVMILNDSTARNQSSTYIKELISEFENRDVEARRKRMERAINLRDVVIYSLIGVLLIGAVCMLLLMRSRRRANAERNRLLGRLQQIAREHADKSRDDALNLDRQSKELLTMSMSMNNIQEGFEEIETLTTDASDTPDHRLDRIRSILKRLTAQNNVSKMFSIYFEGINQTFFNRLFKLHPELSSSEVRMSGYMLMGMSTKEIAILTNRSIRTVENIKYTLRKKLGVAEASESYFRRIASATDDEFATLLAAARQTPSATSALASSPAPAEP